MEKDYKLLVKIKNTVMCLPIKDIMYICTSGLNLVKIYMSTGEIHLMVQTLDFFKPELLDRGFMRANKQTLLNRDYITGGDMDKNELYINNAKFTVSERRAKVIKHVIGKNLTYSIPPIVNTSHKPDVNKSLYHSKKREILSAIINNSPQKERKLKAINGGVIEIARLEDVVIMEAAVVGTKIYLSNNKTMTSEILLHEYEKELLQYGLLRVTNGEIVNFKHITCIEISKYYWNIYISTRKDPVKLLRKNLPEILNQYFSTHDRECRNACID